MIDVLTRSPRSDLPARQTAHDFVVGTHSLVITADAFLNDRRSTNRSPLTIKSYANDLKHFLEFCALRAIDQVEGVDAELLRSYMLLLAETHSPGGVHAIYRTLRAFLRWIEQEELMPPGWRNPIMKIRAPFVPQEPIEPVGLDDVQALLATCRQRTFHDLRDKAIIFFLLDTGARARELCAIDLEDVELGSGKVTIRQGKGRKPRFVFIGPTTGKALRGYLRMRPQQAAPALFLSRTCQRLTYDGLRQLIERRARKAGLQKRPTPHSFRRAFALNMLRNRADIYSLQRLMGHADISILRRYLAQTTEDIEAAHRRGSPVENFRWT